jgi:hypothetical protein
LAGSLDAVEAAVNQEPSLRLIPDWPRVKQLVAKRMGKSESVVQAMLDSGDSLEKVELAMTVEEVLDDRR